MMLTTTGIIFLLQPLIQINSKQNKKKLVLRGGVFLSGIALYLFSSVPGNLRREIER